MTPAKVKGKRGARAARRGRSSTALTPRAVKRGLAAAEIVIGLDAPEVLALVERVRQVGGAAIGAYREPLSGKPLLLAALPISAVQPTPFQRDLSPTHTRRLAGKIEEAGAFLDPLIVVRGPDQELWTPNGRHRLAAAKVLGLRQIMAIVSPDEELAFRILALNTEKPHNLKDRSLEVIRMARSLASRSGTAKESDFVAEFELPELLTLGIIYEKHGRFAGGAYSPFLRKVERFSGRRLATSIREREGFAAVRRIIAGLQARGFRSPYLRNYVVARINPVRYVRVKKDADAPMPLAAALTRMAAAARKFDLDSVKSADVALVASAVAD